MSYVSAPMDLSQATALTDPLSVGQGGFRTQPPTEGLSHTAPESLSHRKLPLNPNLCQ